MQLYQKSKRRSAKQMKSIFLNKRTALAAAATGLLLITGTLEAEPPEASPPRINAAEAYRPKYRPDEVVVKFHDYADASTQNFTAQRHGATVAKRLRFSREPVATFKLQAGENPEIAAARIARDPNVEFAEPNYIYYASATTPNDTQFSSLWGLKNTASSANDMDMENAWDMTTDCSSATVAVLDTGINYDHEDLANNMWDGSSCVDEDGSSIGGGCPNHGWDFADNDNDPMDPEGHGTHVAGTIGAEGDNSTGISGVCWNADIMAVRVLGLSGGSNADIADGIYFAVRNGAKVINMSLGGPGSSTLMSNAIDYANSNDVLVVVAAGNEDANLDGSSNNSYPCEYSQNNVLCVAALKDTYELDDSYSNYDADSVAANRAVDVAAPGTDILSAWYTAEEKIYDGFSSFAVNWTSSSTNSSPNVWGDNSCFVSGFGYVSSLNITDDCSLWSSPNDVAINTTAIAYRSFPVLSGATTVNVQFFYYSAAFGSGGICYDYFSSAYRSGAGDPFSSGTTLQAERCDGDNGTVSFNLGSCTGSGTCTVGFRYYGTGAAPSPGALVTDFVFTSSYSSNSYYTAIQGTSMATPHVAGLAAMLRSYNPSFTAADTLNAIAEGGKTSADVGNLSTINGKTRYEIAVDGYGAMRHLEPVTITSATLQ